MPSGHSPRRRGRPQEFQPSEVRLLLLQELLLLGEDFTPLFNVGLRVAPVTRLCELAGVEVDLHQPAPETEAVGRELHRPERRLRLSFREVPGARRPGRFQPQTPAGLA
jgi:hypothetical protein